MTTSMVKAFTHQCIGAVCCKRTLYGAPCPECQRVIDAAQAKYGITAEPVHPVERTAPSQYMIQLLIGTPRPIMAKLDEMVGLDEAYLAKVRAFNAAAKQAYGDAVAAAVTAFGIGHEVTRKIRRAGYRRIQEIAKGAEMKKRVLAEVEAIEKRQAEAQEASAQADLPLALQILAQAGEPALASAKAMVERAREIKVEMLKREIMGDFISFAGDDPCQDCPGWDGTSYRCECGAVRVCWHTSGSLGDLRVYAGAH